MVRRCLFVLLFSLAALGCDSGSDSDDVKVFSGPYEGEARATFTGGTAIDFDVRLDLEEPDTDGRYEGALRIVRGPVGGNGEITATGTVFGLVSGSSFSVSGSTTVESAARAVGGGIGFGGEGTINGSTITLTTATISDFSYAGSAVFSMTLR